MEAGDFDWLVDFVAEYMSRGLAIRLWSLSAKIRKDKLIDWLIVCNVDLVSPWSNVNSWSLELHITPLHVKDINLC